MQTRELFLLVGPTRPDKIELEKALLRWSSVSWFLDDTLAQDIEASANGATALPKAWRLGSRPNLTQMQHDACRFRVPPEFVQTRLVEEIGKLKSLTAGASGQGVRVHNMPDWPRLVEDDGEFHFVVLAPKAASIAGSPSLEAKRFIEETTAADRPRVYRNAIVLATPSIDGLDAARAAMLKYLGWEEVRRQLKDQQVDPIREALLSMNLEGARKALPDAIRQAYCIVVTVDEGNQIQAYRIQASNNPLFISIKQDKRVRIQETPVSADALLPGGPYDLWREGEVARRFKDLVTAFAQFPHLPKMLNRQAILDTLVDGYKQGMFVLRQPRPDRTYRTFWRKTPDDVALKDPALEVVLLEQAELTEIVPDLLSQNSLPGLSPGKEITVQQVYDYFSGQHVVQVLKQGYAEPAIIPNAGQAIVDVAIQEAVKRGLLWLVSGPASIYAEEISPGLLTPGCTLLPPPAHLSPMDVLPARLPEAWQSETTSAVAIAAALSGKYGKPMPWWMVREAMDGAFQTHYLERTVDSRPWPCDYGDAQWIKVRVPEFPPPPSPPPPPPADEWVAEADLQPSQIQDLAEGMGDLLGAAAGSEIKFRLRVELDKNASQQVKQSVNSALEGISPDLSFDKGR